MRTIDEIQVMNYQIDSFGVLHHGRYLEILEAARWRYCYENNLMNAFHEKGIHHVVVNINLNYAGSARFGEVIAIATQVSRVTPRSVVFKQTVSRHKNQIVTAEITNVFLRSADHTVINVTEMEPFWEDLKLTGSNIEHL